MKNLMTAVALSVACALSGNVLAHGELPKHGGIISSTNDDISFELVQKDGRTAIYVEDHGKPVVTTGAAGKLTVLSGTDKAELPLEPAGDNVMVAKGDAKLTKGAKAIASVTLADKRTVSVRFSIK